MNPSSADIKDMLEAVSSLGLEFGVDLFVGREPSDPDDCVTIFDTGGYPPQLTMTQGEDFYSPSVQIRVRNNSYLTGYNLISDIVTALHGQAQETWNGVLYSVIKAVSDPALLDWDDNQRARFIVNFNLKRR